MICSSRGTIVIATGNSFPRLPVKKSSGFHVNGIRNHLPINVTARRRSLMAMTMRSESSPLILTTSGASDGVGALFSIRELKRFVTVIQALIFFLLRVVTKEDKQKKRKAWVSPRKTNIGCGGVSPSPTTTTTVVDEDVSVRRALAMRRVLEDNGGDGISVRDFSLFTTKRSDTLFTQSWTPVGSVKNRSILLRNFVSLSLVLSVTD